MLLGITTNWRFLQDVLAHPTFVEGKVHTAWIDREFTDWEAPQCDLPPEVLAAAALTEAQLLQAGSATVAPAATEAGRRMGTARGARRTGSGWASRSGG